MSWTHTVKTILVAALLTIPGCTIRHGDYTVLTNKLVPTTDFELSKADRQHVKGEDVAHIIIVIATGVPTLEGALDDALEKGNGDVMTDVTISFTNWYIPYIYGQSKWTVEGDVVKTRR